MLCQFLRFNFIQKYLHRSIDIINRNVYNKYMERRSEVQGSKHREVMLMTSKEFAKLTRAQQVARFEAYKKAAQSRTLNR